MAFDEQLAERVRKQLNRRSGVTEKKMFGGLAFLINGNMSVGVHRNELIVRMAPGTAEAVLKESGARPFDMAKRPIKDWLLVGGAGVEEPAALAKWVRRGVEYASSLPKK